MWRDYSASFVKRNRASSVSVMMSAFIASLLLSLLCCFFYNVWVYDVESVVREEGDWHVRIIGNLDEEDLNTLTHFANVESVTVNEKMEDGLTDAYPGDKVFDVCFYHVRTICRDMTLVSEKLGLRENQIVYHYPLLAMYFVRIPGDEAPRLVMPLYFAVVATVCISLILVIHNSFAVSMNARVGQLGILSSVGATPRQIRACLLQEAAALCALPLVAGSLAGVGLGYGMIRMMDSFAVQMAGRHSVTFCYHPLILVLTLMASALTVLVAAWIPARKLAKLTPLEAVRGAEESALRHKKHSPFLALLFGIEGELAGNALKAQKKSLRTSALSLTFSFLGFTVVMCFFTLSDISTEYTYFAKYQDTWDVMATVKDAKIEELDVIGTLKEAQEAQGASSCVVYQKAYAVAEISRTQISKELDSLGGPLTLSGESGAVKQVSVDKEETEDRGYLLRAPVVILDDKGFLEYCGQIGAAPRLDGTVILNRIWDSANSNFRYRKYIPYVKEDGFTTILQNGMAEKNGKTGVARLPVIAYTDKPPILREEYEDYALVHILPLSLWKDIAGRIADVEPDVMICVLAVGEDGDKATADKLEEFESVITRYIGRQYETETENRVQEKITNDRLIFGYKIVTGALCGLLAVIGIANVFSFTMGFLRQRRKEFARYLSVGMTPAGLKKMFCIEAMVIAGRPVMVTLPLTGLFVGFSLKASYLNPAEFWEAAPYLPVMAFIGAVFGFVMLAYYIGGRRILKDNLAEMLRFTM